MPLRRSGLAVSLPGWLCAALAGLLILAAAAGHLAYFLQNPARIDLAPDEAHYWDWSRHLDWSYYSKGPLIAYLIRGGCELAGPWSLQQTGTLMPAVRLPAVLCGCLVLAGVYVLTVQVFGRPGLALAVVAGALTLPMVAAGSMLMTIDAPYTCCWTWALVAVHRAVFRGSGWAWPAAGLLVGLGILAKYTMVLFLPSVFLFLLTSPPQRRLLLRPGFWVMGVLAGLCCLPILVWNLQHGWVTFRHVSRLGGVHAPGIAWQEPVVYLATQCGLLLLYWFIIWVWAMIEHHPGREPDAGVRYLWWLSAPMFLVFLGFSLKTGGGEPNWPVTAYISGMVLTAAWLAEKMASPAAWFRRLAYFNTFSACAAGLALLVIVHHTDWVYPLVEPLAGPRTTKNPFPMRRLDPTCRLRGWRPLAGQLDQFRAELTRQDPESREPILAATNWSMPGEIGFYCAGQPTVYCVGRIAGDRVSQYDLWANPLDDPEPFKGRTFLIIGTLSPYVRQGFDFVEPTRVLEYNEAGQPITAWEVNVCHGFKGFPRVAVGLPHY
jgi:hypothetical protein